MDGKKDRPRTEAELRRKLDEQLGFLKRSADDFDEGHTEEAVRLAATLRLLLHDKNRSKSLLGQLNMKDVGFCDTSGPNDPENICPYSGLISLELGPKEARYVARLDDDIGEIKRISFDEWWNAEVFRDVRKRTLSRQSIVLTAADQDGGAHVDPVLDDTYSAFSVGEALGWKSGGKDGERPVEHPERMAIRQIAHEVLKTLAPKYSKMPRLKGFVMKDLSIKPVGPAPQRPVGQALGQKKVGRNQPCPCGSGKKFKKCCGR